MKNSALIRGNFHSQRGFSLVEIMIAITLGIILLGGAIQIYLSSKNGYRLQEGIAGMQENGRYAIRVLRENILKAGYPRVDEVIPFDSTQTNDNSAGASDQITVQYQTDATVTTDCLGNPPPPGINLITNQLSIAGDTLSCLGSGNAAPQPLVDDIEAMHILYGLDDDGDSVANRYVTATEAEAGVITLGTPDWNNIVSVRIALLARSRNPIGPVESRNYQLLDTTITRNDALAHRVFTTTIPLRNRTP
jgi:type IV pilus assembly protein PilW